jgi:hypothetical protein
MRVYKTEWITEDGIPKLHEANFHLNMVYKKIDIKIYWPRNSHFNLSYWAKPAVNFLTPT